MNNSTTCGHRYSFLLRLAHHLSPLSPPSAEILSLLASTWTKLGGLSDQLVAVFHKDLCFDSALAAALPQTYPPSFLPLIMAEVCILALAPRLLAS